MGIEEYFQKSSFCRKNDYSPIGHRVSSTDLFPNARSNGAIRLASSTMRSREREREMNSVNLMFFSSFTASGCAFPIYCPPRSRMNGTPVRNATVRLSDACPMNQVATAATVLCQGVGIKKQMEGSARTAWCQWTEKNQAEAPPFAPPKASNPTEKPSNTPANSVKTQ